MGLQNRCYRQKRQWKRASTVSTDEAKPPHVSPTPLTSTQRRHGRIESVGRCAFITITNTSRVSPGNDRLDALRGSCVDRVGRSGRGGAIARSYRCDPASSSIDRLASFVNSGSLGKSGMTPLETEADPNIRVGPLRWGRPDRTFNPLKWSVLAPEPGASKSTQCAKFKSRQCSVTVPVGA